MGVLPKTERWRNIVNDIAQTATGECSPGEVTAKIAKAIDARFRQLHLDPGVQDAFSFLLAVSIAGRSDFPQKALASLGIDLGERNATPLALTQALSKFIDRNNGSLEYAELARIAAGQALAHFYNEESRQPDLLDPSADPSQIWRAASDGGGFCVLARQFFSNLTSEYLKYFIDREASAVLPSIEARTSLQNAIEAHVDRVIRHSFETSKITQSFAAGWYNKNAQDSVPHEGKQKLFWGLPSTRYGIHLGGRRQRESEKVANIPFISRSDILQWHSRVAFKKAKLQKIFTGVPI